MGFSKKETTKASFQRILMDSNEENTSAKGIEIKPYVLLKETFKKY